MKKPTYLVIAITLVTATIGLALWASGYPPPREELSGWRVTAYAVVTWPLFFALAGLVFSAPVLYMKRNQPGIWQTKEGRVALIGALSNPLVMLIMQILYPLEAMNLMSDYAGDLAFLIMFTFIFIMLGNYAAVQQPGSPHGLRNRWTLADDRVWTKTHRLFGRLLIGALLIVSPIIAWIDPEYGISALIVTMVSTFIIATIYSHHLSSRGKRKNAA